MIKIGIVIVNWNGKEDTLACLDSLGRDQINFQSKIIVVDNGSNDGSVETLRKKFPNVYLIENKKNLGFAGGNNEGIKFALNQGVDFVFLVNNDTILQPQTIYRLVDQIETSHEIGMVGPKIYFAAGFEFHKEKYKSYERGKVLWYAGGIIDWDNCLGFHRGVDEVDNGQYDNNEETDFLSGCAMFVRSDVFKKLGLFDENYYLYYEDLDFSMRVRKAGYKIYYVPQASLWHKNAGSSHSGSNLQDYYITRNRIRFGFTYAKFSTKMALLRESINLQISGRKWQKYGVVDAFLGRWGKGSYEKIKRDHLNS